MTDPIKTDWFFKAALRKLRSLRPFPALSLDREGIELIRDHPDDDEIDVDDPPEAP